MAGLGVSLPKGAWLQAEAAPSARSQASSPGFAESYAPGQEKRMECDVLVAGGGFAGLFAAIKAREQGASVILLDKAQVGRAGQSPFSSSFVAFNPEWGHDMNKWMNFLNGVSEYVNNRYWTQKVLEDSWATLQDLLSWGVEFKRDKNGNLQRLPVTEGITEQIMYAHSARNAGPSDKNHVVMCRKQAEKVGVKILDRTMLQELMTQNGRVVGAIGAPMDSFDQYVILAKTVVLCTGGSSLKPLGYPPLVPLTSDGDAMAYRIGAELLGKEFISVKYSVVDAPGIIGRRGLPKDLDLYLGMEPGVGLFEHRIDAEGHEIPERPKGVTEYKFAYLENDFEVHAGKAPLLWDVNGHQRLITGAGSLGLGERKADGLWPANHDCGSNVPGLYAAGDALGTMQNGAVYNLRGACTLACMVTGKIAGVAAAKEAARIAMPAISEKEIARARQVAHGPHLRQGGFSPQWVTYLLKNTVSPYFINTIKKADRLQATLTMIEFMQEHLVPMLIARDPHELRLAHETRNMVLCVETRLRSQLFRTESRGNHYREDYPHRDDKNWLAWTKVKQEGGKMKLVKVDMPAEWKTDLDKPYRQRYPYPYPGEEGL